MTPKKEVAIFSIEQKILHIQFSEMNLQLTTMARYFIFMKDKYLFMRRMEDKLAGIICDLIRINKDRVDCYKRFMSESEAPNMELKEIFYNKANKSRKNAEELTSLIPASGRGGFPENTIVPGKIFQAWCDAKKMFTGKDRKAVLNDCECGEEAALEAYKTALTSDSLNDYASRKLIMDQKYSLQTSQDMIKRYRDLQGLVLLTRYDPQLIWNQNL
jgi:uncharacterized protein (TIGR02284 family)